jgi:hypothetical protein
MVYKYPNAGKNRSRRLFISPAVERVAGRRSEAFPLTTILFSSVFHGYKDDVTVILLLGVSFIV